MHALGTTLVAWLFLMLYYGLAGVSAQQTITGTVGTTVRMSCDTTVKNTSIFWRHQRTLSARDQYVCIRSRVVPAYAERFSLVAVSTGYILTILSVNVNDSGTYICIEEDGLGLRHYTTLVVRGPHSLSSIIAKPGDSAVLPCHGTFVQWVYQKDQNSAEIRIFDENGVQEEFKTKFLVTHSSGPSDYSLTVNNAADADSGNYTCIDTAGVESRHTVHLKVSVPATTTAPPEISSRDTTLIISVAVATTAVVVAVGALIPLCYFVIVPRWRRKRMKRHEKKNDEKQWHDECIRLLLCHSLESNVLQVKFNLLKTELAKLDLSDVISNLMKERILTAQESIVLKKNSDHRNQSEQLLKRLDASNDTEPYVKLRQAMLLHKRFRK